MIENLRGEATQVQNALITFARFGTQIREKNLPQLVSRLSASATKETLGMLVEQKFQRKLIEAVELTLNTPFEVDGNPQIPWAGGFTVVALDSRGNVSGSISKPAQGLEQYGALEPYALAKAVEFFHLDQSGRQGGLGDVDNFNYLASLDGLMPGKNLFTGTPQEPTNIGNETFYIGASGCAVKTDYLEALLGGAKPSHNTQAGLFDSIFAGLTDMYLTNNTLLPTKRPEPKSVQQLRINN